MKHSESLTKIAPAILRAQKKIKAAIKDANNPFFKSKYADLESCWEAVKEPLHSEGLAVVQTMGFLQGAGPTVITTLIHESGEYITGEQPVCAKADDPQNVGSAITYARRYGLSAITALIQVDDDAESFMNTGPRQQQPSRPPVQAVPPPASREELGHYVIKTGKKFAGRRLDSIPQPELQSWVDYLSVQELKGATVTDLSEAKAWLDFCNRPASTGVK